MGQQEAAPNLLETYFPSPQGGVTSLLSSAASCMLHIYAAFDDPLGLPTAPGAANEAKACPARAASHGSYPVNPQTAPACERDRASTGRACTLHDLHDKHGQLLDLRPKAIKLMLRSTSKLFDTCHVLKLRPLSRDGALTLALFAGVSRMARLQGPITRHTLRHRALAASIGADSIILRWLE